MQFSFRLVPFSGSSRAATAKLCRFSSPVPGRIGGPPSPEPRLIKPRTPPGVMELLPPDQIAFQRMLDVIRRNYERFGFLPVETPVMELSDVLLTKSVTG